jgi:hypothetical protein
MAQMGNIHQTTDLTEWIAMGLHLVAELAGLGGQRWGGDFVGFVIPTYLDTHSR